MEQLVLTTPTTATTTQYAVRGLVLSRNPTAIDESFVRVTVEDNFGVKSAHEYSGAEAAALLTQLNTMNFSTVSLQKRLLQKLVADGKLPPGTVTGTPS